MTLFDVRAAVAAQQDRARRDLEELVRIPSVSGDAERRDDVRRAADWVARQAAAVGADGVDVVRADAGAPAVIATWAPPPGAPTVLLYAHLDVQPTGPVEEWTNPPFEPTERDGRLYARGAADDKAGVLLHLAVLRAFAGRPPVGVVLFVEGEEEIGSPTLPALLAEHHERLRSEVIVIADAANAAVDVPSFTTTLRGIVDAVVEVRVLERPVHSGLFGGAVPDALSALCRLLATLHDDVGNVAVAGLVSGSSDVPDVDADLVRSDAGVLPGVHLVGSGSVPDRLWHRPALSVLGIDAPGTEEAAKVLLPRARAKVSLRIPPGEDAMHAVERLTEHLRRNAPWGAHVEVTPGAVGQPFALNNRGKPYEVARQAFADAYGNDVVETGIGGSIPFLAEFARAYPGATVLVTGVGDPASRWHGIDESLHLGMWEKAMVAEALLLSRLAS